MKWEKKRIRDFAKVYDGPHATPKESETGAIFLGIKNIRPEGGLNLSEIRHINESEYEKWTKRVTPQAGDIVLSYEATLHRYAIIPNDFVGCLGRRMALVRVNQNQVSETFLYYTFLSDNWRGFIDANKLTGATVDRISITDFPDYHVPIPPLPTQRRIASILSAYDDLIENNLKRIKLLEEKAAIAHQEIISTGNTETKFFEDFCSIVHGYAFKSNDFSEDKTFDIVVRMGNFQEGGGVQFENNTKFLNENFEYNPKYKLEPNDLVMVLSDVTREGRIIGNVGFIPANGKTYLLNQRVGKIVSDEKYRQWLYSTFNSKKFKDYCLSCANSATVLNFNNKDLYKFKIELPKEKELNEFTEKVKPIFKLIGNLGEQNTKLREARDILLPRLMSGEIDI